MDVLHSLYFFAFIVFDVFVCLPLMQIVGNTAVEHRSRPDKDN